MRRIPFEILLAVLILVVHLYIVLLPGNRLVNWFHSDDAFYYFKVAQNITEGHGVTFDQIGRDSGFHPLWMVVITPLFAFARYDLLLPLRMVALLSTALSAGTAILLFRLSRRILHPYAAGFIAVFWAFHPFVHANITQMGLESALSGFMIAWLIYRLVQEHEAETFSALRLLFTGLIGALTVLARLDNVFLVVVAGIWVIFSPAKIRYLLIADTVMIAFGAFLSSFLRVGLGPGASPYLLAAQVLVLVALAVRIPVYYFFGLYAGPKNETFGSFLLKAITGSITATGIIVSLMFALQALNVFLGFPRIIVAYEAVFGLGALLLTRFTAALITKNQDTDQTLQWATILTRAGCYLVPVGLILIAYMGSSYLYFGTFMPVSGQIKRWWGTIYTVYGHSTSTFPELMGFFRSGPWELARQLIRFPSVLPERLRIVLYSIPLALLVLRPGYRFLLAISVQKLALFPLLAGGLLQMVSYTGTSYTHMRGWYWAAQMMLIALLVGIVIDALYRWLSVLSSGSRRVGIWSPAALIVGALCVLIVLSTLANLARYFPPRMDAASADAYLRDTRALEESTQPGDRIGFTGGGTTAYFIQGRTIVNLDGLMNTYEYYEQLKNWQAVEYLDKIGLQYVVAREYVITKSEPYTQFEGRLEEIKHIGENTFYRWLPGTE
jgi:hypothetical protein